jgi:hypothetical protein
MEKLTLTLEIFDTVCTIKPPISTVAISANPVIILRTNVPLTMSMQKHNKIKYIWLKQKYLVIKFIFIEKNENIFHDDIICNKDYSNKKRKKFYNDIFNFIVG